MTTQMLILMFRQNKNKNENKNKNLKIWFEYYKIVELGNTAEEGDKKKSAML